MTDKQFIELLSAAKPFYNFTLSAYPVYIQEGNFITKTDGSGICTLWQCKMTGNYVYTDIVEGENWEKIDLPATF